MSLTIVKNDLKQYLYKKQNVHGLTQAQKAARVINADNFMLVITSFFLTRNYFCCHWIFSVSLRDISREKIAVERYQCVSRNMVWGAIFEKGKLRLLFINSGVKVEQHYYIKSVSRPYTLTSSSTYMEI
jgi:hypothetical protein